jgi:predicted membrane channel-forming protein YqfA (hemolysin III family)
MDLFKPYRRIEESDEFIVYEFRTGFVYLLYAILLIIAFGYLTDQSVVSYTGLGLMVLYLCLVSTQYRTLSKRINRASAEAKVEYSGSKWSFANPLRAQIPKEFV